MTQIATNAMKDYLLGALWALLVGAVLAVYVLGGTVAGTAALFAALLAVIAWLLVRLLARI